MKTKNDIDDSQFWAFNVVTWILTLSEKKFSSPHKRWYQFCHFSEFCCPPLHLPTSLQLSQVSIERPVVLTNDTGDIWSTINNTIHCLYSLNFPALIFLFPQKNTSICKMETNSKTNLIAVTRSKIISVLSLLIILTLNSWPQVSQKYYNDFMAWQELKNIYMDEKM